MKKLYDKSEHQMNVATSGYQQVNQEELMTKKK